MEHDTDDDQRIRNRLLHNGPEGTASAATIERAASTPPYGADGDENGETSVRTPRPVSRTIGEGANQVEHDGRERGWWAPYAVLGTLMLLGVLGFFGVFNKLLAFLAATSPDGKAPTADVASRPSTPTPLTSREGTQGKSQAPAAVSGTRQLTVKQLIVMYKGSLGAPPTLLRSKEEAKARATEAMRKAKSGTKFEEVVKEYSDEPGVREPGGDVASFAGIVFGPVFQAALEKATVGEITDVVETPSGFHVLLRTK
jgi:hypothetical protein